jgi:hypothetical protein
MGQLEIIPNFCHCQGQSNLPYHRMIFDKPPAKHLKDKLEYMQLNRMLCKQGMRKFTFFFLVEKNPPRGGITS